MSNKSIRESNRRCFYYEDKHCSLHSDLFLQVSFGKYTNIEYEKNKTFPYNKGQCWLKILFLQKCFCVLSSPIIFGPFYLTILGFFVIIKTCEIKDFCRPFCFANTLGILALSL